MELNFDFRRLLILVACLAGFALMGGFSKPEIRQDGMHHSTQVHKAWFYCVILFVAGAVSVSVVDHSIGYMDPTNLRPAYIFLGIVLMIASFVWLRSLKQAVEPPQAVSPRLDCSVGLG